MNLLQTVTSFIEKTSKKPKCIAIVGPTASGKTSAAIQIAEKYTGEIINADSRQTYRFVPIGTAQPSAQEMEQVPHHLFSFLNPDQECNVAQWRLLAEEKISDIQSRKKLPILCGGTGLFINALTQGFTLPRIAPQPEFRAQMDTLSDEKLWELLHEKDPASAQKINMRNKRFVIRALEILEFSGKKKSTTARKKEAPYDLLLIGITLERKALYELINKRVDAMKEMGFLEEAKALQDQGYSLDDPALQSIGYPQAWQYFAGEISEQELWESMKQKTRNYAKRQLTWWRRDERVQWFDSNTFLPINI